MGGKGGVGMGYGVVWVGKVRGRRETVSVPQRGSWLAFRIQTKQCSAIAGLLQL